jgi:carboxymethylenebutenolidase
VNDTIQAGTVELPVDDETITAYLARPVEGPPAGGMVLIHHMPGYDAGSQEIARRLATWGYAVLMPNLHHRQAPGADPDDAAAAARAAGGTTDDQLVADVGAAAAYLRALPGANGRVGAIGFCSGGRQALLAGCRLPLDAVVDCYGAFVLTDVPAKLGVTAWKPIPDLLPDLACPVLGLFGEQDRNPTPAEVAELDRLLTDLGKAHEFHSFADAGHGFFMTEWPAAYRAAAAGEAWPLVRDFLARHL